MSTTKSVAHVLWRSRGGMRGHVRFVAAHPPSGWTTQAVYGPAELAGYFEDVEYRTVTPLSILRAGRGADVIHAHGVRAGTAALLPRRPPVVLTLHVIVGGSGATARSPIGRVLADVVASRADALVAVSGRAAVGFARARVIPPAYEPLRAPSADRAETRRVLGAAPEDVVVISVARLDRDKRLGLVVRAVESTGCVGWIVGDGPERDNLAGSTSARFRLLGHRDDVSDLLAAADIFALPSRSESYGVAIGEAISAGLPVVATETGSAEELVDGGGVLVDPNDEDAFVNALVQLVGDRERRSRLATIARRMQPPDQLEHAESLGAVYEEALSTSRTGRRR